MDNSGPLEPGSQVFTGTITAWRRDYGEMITDSGVTVPFVTQGHPVVPVGTRVTMTARKFRPLFQIEKMSRAE